MSALSCHRVLEENEIYNDFMSLTFLIHMYMCNYVSVNELLLHGIVDFSVDQGFQQKCIYQCNLVQLQYILECLDLDTHDSKSVKCICGLPLAWNSTLQNQSVILPRTYPVSSML